MYMMMRRAQCAPGQLSNVLQAGIPLIEAINERTGAGFAVLHMATAIVVVIENDCILELAGFFQVTDDSANVPIHRSDLSGVHFHSALLPFLVLGVFPGGNIRMTG